MTLKPKKHKQRFEHISISVNPDTINNTILTYEKVGLELVTSIPLNKDYTVIKLFFKRPV